MIPSYTNPAVSALIWWQNFHIALKLSFWFCFNPSQTQTDVNAHNSWDMCAKNRDNVSSYEIDFSLGDAFSLIHL